jgi:hypothetical protein
MEFPRGARFTPPKRQWAMKPSALSMYARRRGRDAREGRDILAGPSCKITTGSGNDEQTAARRGKRTWKIIATSRRHIRASNATPRIALAKMMASVSENIRASTSVFTTTPLQTNCVEPASLSWLPDADAFDRPCRILFAIAVISDEAPRNQTEAASVAGLVHPQPRASSSPGIRDAAAAQAGQRQIMPRRETTFGGGPPPPCTDLRLAKTFDGPAAQIALWCAHWTVPVQRAARSADPGFRHLAPSFCTAPKTRIATIRCYPRTARHDISPPASWGSLRFAGGCNVFS